MTWRGSKALEQLYRLRLFFVLTLHYIFSSPSFGLATDEQITVRILRTSSTKKTVLVNRGSEEQLQEGDHGKFFVTEGVVARGVVVEVAPHRSIWSIYRLVNPVLIGDGQVMDVKITEELPLTDDETRAIFTPEADLAAGTGAIIRDLPQQVGSATRSSTPANQGSLGPQAGMAKRLSTKLPIEDRKKFSAFEVFGGLSFSRLSGEVTSQTGSAFPGVEGGVDSIIGFEFYIAFFSISAFYQYQKGAEIAYEGALIESSNSDIGLIGKLYFSKDPRRAETLYPYLKMGVAQGKVESTFAGGELLPGATDTNTATGTTRSFITGAGMKYSLHGGFGFFWEVDYLLRRERFDEEPTTAGFLWDKDVSGPRMTGGFSYRF